MTYYLNARLDMMLSNLVQGSVLVAFMLTLFLRFRLALWVMVGLPVCFLGAMMLMPGFRREHQYSFALCVHHGAGHCGR